MKALVNELDYIKEKQAISDKEHDGLDITLKGIPNTTKYIVMVQGWGNWEGKIFYKLKVDYKAKTVQVLNNKIIKGKP